MNCDLNNDLSKLTITFVRLSQMYQTISLALLESVPFRFPGLWGSYFPFREGGVCRSEKLPGNDLDESISLFQCFLSLPLLYFSQWIKFSVASPMVALFLVTLTTHGHVTTVLLGNPVMMDYFLTSSFRALEMT